jgi:hypothetical protein
MLEEHPERFVGYLAEPLFFFVMREGSFLTRQRFTEDTFGEGSFLQFNVELFTDLAFHRLKSDHA